MVPQVGNEIDASFDERHCAGDVVLSVVIRIYAMSLKHRTEQGSDTLVSGDIHD